MIRVAVNSNLLRWARERAGIPRGSLAASFKKLPEWEDGVTQPTLKQVEAFARAVHVPVGYLFFTEPPRKPSPSRTSARSPDTRDRQLARISCWFDPGDADGPKPPSERGGEPGPHCNHRGRLGSSGNLCRFCTGSGHRWIPRGIKRAKMSEEQVDDGSPGGEIAIYEALRNALAQNELNDRATAKDSSGVRSDGRSRVQAGYGSAAAIGSRAATIEETSVVSRHVGDAYPDGKLGWEATLAKFATVRREGGTLRPTAH